MGFMRMVTGNVTIYFNFNENTTIKFATSYNYNALNVKKCDIKKNDMVDLASFYQNNHARARAIKMDSFLPLSSSAP